MFKSKMPMAMIDLGDHTFKVAPTSFVMGVKVTEDGQVWFNGEFNSDGIDKLKKVDQIRFLDFCRGMVASLLNHNFVFEILGKQERVDAMKYSKDTIKPDIAFMIERLKDSNIVKVEFGKNEKEI